VGFWKGSNAISALFCGLLCLVAPIARAQTSTTVTPPPLPPEHMVRDPKSMADIIFMHANVYTGVPANTPFSSILREEAIAVRGDRIQAVGKVVDINRAADASRRPRRALRHARVQRRSPAS